jgi:hypothetical protein
MIKVRIFRNAEIPHGGLRHAALYFDANNKSDRPEHEAWKAVVMSGAIALEEIETQAFTDRCGKLSINVPTAVAKATAG